MFVVVDAHRTVVADVAVFLEAFLGVAQATLGFAKTVFSAIQRVSLSPQAFWGRRRRGLRHGSAGAHAGGCRCRGNGRRSRNSITG